MEVLRPIIATLACRVFTRQDLSHYTRLEGKLEDPSRVVIATLLLEGYLVASAEGYFPTAKGWAWLTGALIPPPKIRTGRGRVPDDSGLVV